LKGLGLEKFGILRPFWYMLWPFGIFCYHFFDLVLLVLLVGVVGCEKKFKNGTLFSKKNLL
jgi:hypothetical protein